MRIMRTWTEIRIQDLNFYNDYNLTKHFCTLKNQQICFQKVSFGTPCAGGHDPASHQVAAVVHVPYHQRRALDQLEIIAAFMISKPSYLHACAILPCWEISFYDNHLQSFILTTDMQCLFSFFFLSTGIFFFVCRIVYYLLFLLFSFLFDCETWSLTLREERKLRVIENRILRRIFGSR